jgi:predicted nucleotidyltransferase
MSGAWSGLWRSLESSNTQWADYQQACFERRLMMLTREKVIRILREEYPHLASEYGVKRIGLFGSYAQGVPNEASDIDIVVEFEHPIGFRFIEFTEYLERVLGKKVDVLTHAGIQGIRIPRIARDIEESIAYV